MTATPLLPKIDKIVNDELGVIANDENAPRLQRASLRDHVPSPALRGSGRQKGGFNIYR